jgi:hypothetical protein
MSHFSASETLEGSNALHFVEYCGSHSDVAVLNTHRAGHVAMTPVGITTIGFSDMYPYATNPNTISVVAITKTSFNHGLRVMTSIDLSLLILREECLSKLLDTFATPFIRILHTQLYNITSIRTTIW